ncbi:MAG: CvpA family protein [Desulfobacula sp.]|jgi:membrane protein required for colicin V production|uniref:CvpA family protein n=1 Tax=Desulfobacula sp. TaxID=2593537 RepID=UPI001D800E03|nr:CvpA family protein [Desulfobacula sp.]MBT3487355.1 CvpA family protein [Desulfobacula sp.]MBT3806587.1 CvpA family protein [Desulfobacula sp.]MBT4026917.1 CvpA family protein [Desulfobacula sp.]MBT4200711.1 CvpA family protein [Desulfobacula sp.]
MNTFDIVIIVVISFCLIRGIFKGLIGEISGIIGVYAGFYGAYTYYPLIAVYAREWIENTDTRNLIAFFILFCGILIIVSLISVLIHKFLKFAFLGWLDRILGLVFGGAKGILIVSVFFIMITTFLPKSSNILTGSQFSPYVAQVSKAMTFFVSKNKSNDFLKNLKGI